MIAPAQLWTAGVEAYLAERGLPSKGGNQVGTWQAFLNRVVLEERWRLTNCWSPTRAIRVDLRRTWSTSEEALSECPSAYGSSISHPL
jgi:hypothetical protein